MQANAVNQQSALSALTQQKAHVIEMSNRLRRSISYNESFDTANVRGSQILCQDLKLLVDAWEATQLGRIAEEVHALNLPHHGN